MSLMRHSPALREICTFSEVNHTHIQPTTKRSRRFHWQARVKNIYTDLVYYRNVNVGRLSYDI